MSFEIREARTDAEVEAAGRVTVAANAEFAPPDPDDPDDPFTTSWAGYLVEMADAAARARSRQAWNRARPMPRPRWAGSTASSRNMASPGRHCMDPGPR